MSVYLLHMMQPVTAGHPCRHYLGWAADVRPRVFAHLHGCGSRLTEVAHERGIEMVLVRIWEGASRTDERRLKNRKNAPALCPLCRGMALQMPLLPGECAYVPSNDITEDAPTQPYNEVAAGQCDLWAWVELETYLDALDAAWFVSQGIDLEAELEDQVEGRLDNEFWATGHW